MSKEISTIAKNIKKYRAKLGESQDKLSKLASITLHTITKIKSGGYTKSDHRNYGQNRQGDRCFN